MTTEIELRTSDDAKIFFEVDFDFTPGEAGERDRVTGVQLQPDYEPSVTLNIISLKGVSDDVLEVIKEMLLEKHARLKEEAIHENHGRG
jgi:hypothetical protein